MFVIRPTSKRLRTTATARAQLKIYARFVVAQLLHHDLNLNRSRNNAAAATAATVANARCRSHATHYHYNALYCRN